MVHCDNDAGNVAIDEEEETYTYHHATYDDAQTTDVASKQKTDVADDASKQKTDVADDASKQKTGVADDSKKQKANDSSDTADVKKQKKKCSRHYGTDGPGIHFEWVPEQVRYASTMRDPTSTTSRTSRTMPRRPRCGGSRQRCGARRTNGRGEALTSYHTKPEV